MLSSPPVNHFANGRSPSSVRSKGGYQLIPPRGRPPAAPLGAEPLPEGDVVALGLLVQGGRRVGPGHEGRIGREAPVLHQEGLDLGPRALAGLDAHSTLLPSDPAILGAPDLA